MSLLAKPFLFEEFSGKYSHPLCVQRKHDDIVCLAKRQKNTIGKLALCRWYIGSASGVIFFTVLNVHERSNCHFGSQEAKICAKTLLLRKSYDKHTKAYGGGDGKRVRSKSKGVLVNVCVSMIWSRNSLMMKMFCETMVIT